MKSHFDLRLLINNELFNFPYLMVSYKLSLSDFLTTPTTTPSLALGVVAQQRICHGNYAKRNCGFKA